MNEDLLGSYWGAKTPAEERAAYAELMKAGMSPAYGEESITMVMTIAQVEEAAKLAADRSLLDKAIKSVYNAHSRRWDEELDCPLKWGETSLEISMSREDLLAYLNSRRERGEKRLIELGVKV